MGWQEARKRYQEGETPTDQKVEDLVARRVLRGLGLVQRNIPSVERIFYGESFPDEAAWVRTERILIRAAKLNSFPVVFEYAVCDTTPTHKEPYDRLDMCKLSQGVVPVILTRRKGYNESLTYSVWPEEELTEFLDPPYTALKRYEDRLVVVQDTERFFAQLDWSSAFLGVT